MRGNEMMKEKQTSGMEWMYSILNGASIAMLVAVLAAIGIMTCMAFASHADAKAKSSNNNSIGEVSFRAGDIKIDATLGGTGGVVAPNRYVPIRATLTNKGDNFKGSVKVISGAVSGTSVAFTKSVSIAAGETIQIKSFFTLPVSGSTVRVALYDKDDDMISSQTAYLQMALTTTDEKQMAVLSDDINKIGYLQSANFAVEEINVADVPEDVRLLESLDVLVINNVDTQSFSAKQVTALQQWVSNGGLLVLGTGAQAEKSLKVFSGKLLNGTIGDARSIQTNLSYAKVDQAEKLALLKEELRKEKLDKVKTFLREHLPQTMYRDYAQDIQGLDYSDDWGGTIFSKGSEIYKQLKKEYSDDDLEKKFQVTISKKEEEKIRKSLVSDKLTVDITSLTLDKAETLVEQDGEALVSKISYGNGSVIVSEFDLALDNKQWSNYGSVIRKIISDNCTTTENHFFDQNVNTYYLDDSLQAGLKYNEVDVLPNITLYAILLIVYVVLIGPVGYTILRRKDKRQLLWVIIPVSAVFCSVLIYLIGTGTRIQKPFINYLSQLEIGAEGTHDTLNTAFSVTSPNNRDYQIVVEGSKNIDPYYNSNQVYYDSSAEQDKTYSYAIEYNSDETVLHMENQASFQSSNLKNSQTVKQKGRMAFTNIQIGESKVSGVVTNNTGYDLEDCMIVNHGDIIVLGSLKAGESISLDRISPSKYLKYADIGSDWEEMVTQAVGANNNGYTEDVQSQRRQSLLKYYGHFFTSGETGRSTTYFYGFTKDQQKTSFTNMFDLNLYGEMAVSQEIDFKDMLVEGTTNYGVLSDYIAEYNDYQTDGKLVLQSNASASSSSYAQSINVTYNIKKLLGEGKKLGLQYTYLDNSEITIYSNYSGSDMTINTNLFMGSAYIYNPKKDRYVKFLTAGSETTLDSLDQYADSEGNVKIRYDVKADSGLDGMYNNIALPKLHIIGR